MYEQQREDQGNNLLGNVVIGAGLLGAGALGANYARSVLKNRNRKAQQVNVNVEQPTGRSGTQMRDLPLLRGSDNSGKSSSPPPRKAQYPTSQEAMKRYMRDIEEGSLGPDYRPTSGPVTGENVGKTWQMNRDYYKAQQEGLDLLTDPRTGEVYRAGGSQSINQIKVAPKNQGGGINLSKQNLMGQGSLTTDQLVSFGQRKSRSDVDYVRNQIASGLEAPAGAISSSVQLKNLPPVSEVKQLAIKEEINPEQRERILRNRQKDMARMSDYMSDVLESTISEAEFDNEKIPSNILKLAERAGAGSIDKQDVSLFKNWAQNQFKNDPTVLGEIQEGLSDFDRIAGTIIKEQTEKRAPSGGPKLAGYSEGPVDVADRQNIRAAQQQQPETLVELRKTSAPFVRDAQNEAIQTANDQSDSKFFKNLQRNEDVDLTIVNEDILDKQKARAFDQLVADAESYMKQNMKQKEMASEIDLNYDYSSEEARQAADVGAALERIKNNPKRVAAEGIIDELRTQGRAERDLARFQAEGLEGGELPGLKAEDNIRQRQELQGSRSMTGEELEEVLLGESKVVDSNMRGRALRGGNVNEEGNFYTDAGTVTYVGESGAETGDFRDASTGIRTDIPAVASVAKTPEGAASILASEAVRKRYRDQGPQRLKGPAADVARSMDVMRQGMEAEPREVLPSTQVPTINRGGYADGEAVITVPAETQFTGDAADAAGPVLFTGKNKRDSAVRGTSPPLTQGGISYVPEVAEYNERMAQNFLNRAIDSGLTQKATPTVEVYETPRLVGPAQLAGQGSVPLSRSAAADPELGPDPSQRTGYARFVSGSKPVGAPSTGAMTVGINYAELPQSDTSYFFSRDIGRAPYAGPVQTYAERLAQSTGGTATPMSMLPDRGDSRTTISIQPPAYNPRYKTSDVRQIEVVSSPEAVLPVDAGSVRKSYPADPNRQYAPQVAAGKQAVVTYPHMRGQSLFPTGTLINDPSLRGGPVKFQGRERREDEYTRPISERLTRGDTMTRFPLTRRG